MMKTLAFNELICFFIFNVSSYELILLVKSSKKVNQSRPGTQPLFLYVLLSLWATPLLTIPPKSLIVVNSLKLKINFLMYGNVDRSFTFDKPLPCRFSTYKKCSSCNICIIANSCYDVISILKYWSFINTTYSNKHLPLYCSVDYHPIAVITIPLSRTLAWKKNTASVFIGCLKMDKLIPNKVNI